jgi:WD40 repeat protein
MSQFSFDAQPTAALFDRQGAVFTLGDGAVQFDTGERVDAHAGPVLSAVLHPSGEGVVTGGDDGRLVWSRREDAGELAVSKGAWIDAVATSPASGLIAFSAGRTVTVLDVKDPTFRRTFEHERTVSGLAFDPKGRRLAASTYGGVALWFARIEKQKPTFLKWAGSHTGVTVSPDGNFVVSTMQDAQLHGWRLKDSKDMRMGGYPSKVRAIAFLSKGALLATSGAQGTVLWPFVGSNGPMGKEATEIGYDAGSQVAMVAAALDHAKLAAGLSDGRVWVAEPAAQGLNYIRADRGAPIAALAMSRDGTRVAWADEDGEAGVAPV